MIAYKSSSNINFVAAQSSGFKSAPLKLVIFDTASDLDTATGKVISSNTASDEIPTPSEHSHADTLASGGMPRKELIEAVEALFGVWADRDDINDEWLEDLR
jgi:hypothetical protein